jgi:hypothetical protein|tara:strand:- start:292 stop:477 length:186 start_codon:yes stop_codon:yes gene_type:complete
MRDELLSRIDKAANDYNKTKDDKYKELWYKLIKEFNQQETDYQGGSAYKAMLKLFADNLKK